MTNNIFQLTSPKWWQISINHLLVMWVLFSLGGFLFYGGSDIFWKTLTKSWSRLSLLLENFKPADLKFFWIQNSEETLTEVLWDVASLGLFFIGVLSLCSENTFKDNKITYRMHISHVFFILCIFFVLYHFSSFF